MDRGCKGVIIACLCSVLSVERRARADEVSLVDEKSKYHLFRPTPQNLLRSVSPDDGPYTIDAGRLQIEVDPVCLTTEEAGAATFALGATYLKVGLTSDTDLQLGFTPLRMKGTATGIGDLTLRVGKNLWGNDGGSTALAVVPFVQRRASGDGEGAPIAVGLVLPFTWNVFLSSSLNLVFQAEALGGPRPLSTHWALTVNWTEIVLENVFVAFEVLAQASELSALSLTAAVQAGALLLAQSIQLDMMLRSGLKFGDNQLEVLTGVAYRF